jgi:pimeloyl-ACP methyl ester carboxylesterase
MRSAEIRSLRVFQPEVRYARSKDGVSLAWTSIGDGPIPIVVVGPMFGQIEIAWEEPAFEGFITRLAVGARVVLFDRRGSGLSDQPEKTNERQFALAHLACDVEAVLDAAAIDRAVVLGASLGGFTAQQFASTYPTRTSLLVVVSSTARIPAAPDYEIGIDPSDLDPWIERAVAALAPAPRSRRTARRWRATCAIARGRDDSSVIASRPQPLPTR